MNMWMPLGNNDGYSAEIIILVYSDSVEIPGMGITLTRGVWMPHGFSEAMPIEKITLYIPGNLVPEDVLPTTVALKADVIAAPATATVGQIIQVTAVDDNGKPTAWACVDMPKAAAVADAAGETPTAAEYNALLTALRDAGLIAI
jgi:hypothetical protein